jgi:phospholipid/cholesterol/gamma-HCH transport system ATP-binding protein
MAAASGLPARDQPAAAEAIEVLVEGVHRSFGRQTVLRGIDLTVRRGELVTIVGPSGCGKSVLLEVMTGRLEPDAGRVLMADHERPGDPLVDVHALDESARDELRRHWAIVFQHNALFSGTVRQNIALWLEEVAELAPREIEARVRRSVERVGLDPDRVLEVSRDELSGGMAKRVAIARAIAMEPRLIFYDEPTTGLDPRHAALIHDLVREVHAGARGRGGHGDVGPRPTTVVITHDTTLLRRLQPRIVMLFAGRVHFDGPWADFIASDDPEIRPYLEAMCGLHERAG